MVTKDEVRPIKVQYEDPTSVEIVTSTYISGMKVACDPRIVFKVVIFKNGKMKNCFLHVEPNLTE